MLKRRSLQRSTENIQETWYGVPETTKRVLWSNLSEGNVASGSPRPKGLQLIRCIVTTNNL